MKKAIIAAAIGCAGLLVARALQDSVSSVPFESRHLSVRGGDGVLDSVAFGFDGRAPRVHLDVRGASADQSALGTASLVLGGILAGGGAFALPFVAVASAFGGGGGNVIPYLVIGSAVGLGVVLLLTGAILKATAPRTRVVQVSPTAAVRTPEWVGPRVATAPTDLGWTFAF